MAEDFLDKSTAVVYVSGRALCKTAATNQFIDLTYKNGGAERNRTAGLFIANEALSQLSYSPSAG